MVTVTPAAEEYLAQLLKTQAPGTGVRIFVANPGTPGVECGILYCPKRSVAPADEIFPHPGFDVVIDPSSLPYLEGAELDFRRGEDGKGGLTFRAPNLRKSPLGPGATLREKLELYFRTTVNPGLAAHGGSAKLEDVRDGVVSVSFSGGCRGCSLVNVTLKDGIEAGLRQAFPGLVREVLDVTEHRVTGETWTERDPGGGGGRPAPEDPAGAAAKE